MTKRDTDDRVRIVHRALTDLTTSHKKIADELGCSRDLIRKVRCGLIWCDVLPDLERERLFYQRRCTGCQFASSDGKRCDLDIPESQGAEGNLNVSYAIYCSSYFAINEPTGNSGQGIG